LKAFYRISIALSLFLIIAFSTSGLGAATQSIYPYPPTANFEYTHNEGFTYYFWDRSTNAEIISINFGDKSPVETYPSGGPNIIHTYSKPGNYRVTFAAYNAFGSSSVSKIISIPFV
jgi:PKD repeat protein